MVLKNINLTINSQQIFGIIGTSGAGKSTLIRLINGLEIPSQGSIELDSKIQSSMIFQSYALLQSKTVYENVRLALKFSSIPKKEHEKKITDTLDYVGMTEKSNAYPSELSGGQKQRVGIARALVTNPSLLLCDEITSALDPNAKKKILALLKKVNQELKTTIVLVTHEMEAIKEICDEVAVIDQGEIIECKKTEELFLFPEKKITKDFLSDIIYPIAPKQAELNKGEAVYYLLLNAEQYHFFQKNVRNGYVYDIKTVHIKGIRYFALYLISEVDIGSAWLQEHTIRYERKEINVP
nr:ATP-binding cassette domain-containing protein [Enterococcus sp. 665A]